MPESLTCPFCGESGLPIPTKSYLWYAQCGECCVAYWSVNRHSLRAKVRTMMQRFWRIRVDRPLEQAGKALVLTLTGGMKWVWQRRRLWVFMRHPYSARGD